MKRLEGKKLVDAHIEISDQNFDGLIERLSEEEQEEFVKAMKSIVSILEKL